jgi:hypothetical protein
VARHRAAIRDHLQRLNPLLRHPDFYSGAEPVLGQILARLTGEGLLAIQTTKFVADTVTGGPVVALTAAGRRFAEWTGNAGPGPQLNREQLAPGQPVVSPLAYLAEHG